MNVILIVALIYFVMMAGTSNQSSDFDREAIVPVKTSAPALKTSLDILSYVPSDTFFFYGGLEPTPLISMFQGVVSNQDIQTLIEAVRRKSAEAADAQSGNPSELSGMSPALKMSFGLTMEYMKVEGKPDIAAKVFGIGTQLETAVYSIGNTPIMRVKLADTTSFNKHIEASEASGNVSGLEEVIEGVTFRAYALAEGASENDIWAAYNLYIAAHKDYALLFVATSQELKADTSKIIGEVKPTQSIVQAGHLESLIKTYQFDPRTVGYLDELAIIDALTRPGSVSNPLLYLYANMTTVGGFILEAATGVELLAVAAGTDPSEDYLESLQAKLRSPACHTDLVAMASMFPRSVNGYKTYDVGKMPMEFDLLAVTEVNNPELLTDLQSLRGFVPNHLRQLPKGILLGLGMGIDAGALVPFLTKTLQSFTTAEYTCEPLLDIQTVASEYSGQVVMGAAAISGVINGIKGLSISLFDLDVSRSGETNDVQVNKVDALVTLSAENPSTLLMMAAGIQPAFGMLNIPEDGSAVDFPMPMPWPGLEQPKMAIKGSHIVLFVGEKSTAIAEQLSSEGLSKNAIATLSLDSVRIMDKVVAEVKRDIATQGTDGDKEHMLKLMSMLNRLNAKINYQFDISTFGPSSAVEMTYQVD